MKNKLILLSGLLLLASAASQAQVGVDGAFGAEWAGVAPKSVAYSASAALSNFAAPSNENHVVAYDIYLRSDTTFVYGLFQTKPAGLGLDNYDPGFGFNNISLDTDPLVSAAPDVGFELQNNRAFKSGVLYNNLDAFGLVYRITMGTTYANGGLPTVVEFAMPWSYFKTDPQGIGFPLVSVASPYLQLQRSQSFGYSVAGGPTYGPTLLGRLDANAAFSAGVTAPEPATLVIVLVGMGFILTKWRRSY
jgi:hypothetical protein